MQVLPGWCMASLNTVLSQGMNQKKKHEVSYWMINEILYALTIYKQKKKNTRACGLANHLNLKSEINILILL